MSVEKYTAGAIGYQFKPFAVCPFPPRTRKISITEGEFTDNGYKPVWIKKNGDQVVKIVADPTYGVPHGQDNLVVLYLIRAAMEQGGPVIQFKSISDYLKTFEIDLGGKSWGAANSAFRRIYYSTWFWEDKRKGLDVSVSFRVIRQWNVMFDESKGSHPLFESFIELTPEFWDLTRKYPIPCNLNAVIALKDNPTACALYLWLVYRTFENWMQEKKEVFIPFFGPNGLHDQLSSDISRVDHFRGKMWAWLDLVKEVWPDCPVNLKKPQHGYEKVKGRSKRLQDGIYIHVERPGQLHVSPHWDKQIRLAQEKAAAAIEAASKPCPQCGEKMPLQPGKVMDHGPLPDYFRCTKCRVNYYKKDHPELFKD